MRALNWVNIAEAGGGGGGPGKQHASTERLHVECSRHACAQQSINRIKTGLTHMRNNRCLLTSAIIAHSRVTTRAYLAR